MTSEFIMHGNFIVRIKEIRFVRLIDLRTIEVFMNGEGNKTLTMEYDTVYEAKEAFAKLTIDSDAICLEHHWKHPLVEEMFFTRNLINNLQEEMEKIRKELYLMRKLLKTGIRLNPSKS
jgi:hypothetical protein